MPPRCLRLAARDCFQAADVAAAADDVLPARRPDVADVSRGSAGAPMDVAVGHDAAADARADLDQEQMLGVGPVHPVLAAGHDVDVVVDQHGRAVEVGEPLGDGEVVPARHDRELERVLAST